MGVIKKLDTFTSNRIAAGEVVERPASIVKELVENALDAQATSVVVEIRGGGVDYIRVSDNGVGIAADDTLIAFERHATSKIAAPDDLDAIGTLGFRGEALSSIAAVAQVELTTRARAAESGTVVRIHGGEPISQLPVGCPEGTTLVVQNVFYNTPARLKFLKKPHIEAGYIGDYLARMILARPDVSFKYVNNGTTVYQSAGDTKLLTAIYTVYGGDLIPALRSAEHTVGGIEIRGYVGGSGEARTNRSAQSFFVNGRYIRSVRLSSAVQEGYGTRLMGGQFPFCVLNIALPLEAVDVNIHPNKLDVRFRDEAGVSEAIVEAVRIALGERRSESAERYLRAAERETQKREDSAAKRPKQEQESVFRSTLSVSNAPAPPILKVEEQCAPSPPTKQEAARETQPPAPPVRKPAKKEFAPIDDSHIRILNAPDAFSEPVREAVIVREADRSHGAPVFSPAAEPFVLIGQAFASYILVQQGESLFFIDQHAAHERLLFDRFSDAAEPVAAQHLLADEPIRLTSEEYAQLRQHEAFIRSFGFSFSFAQEPVIRLSAVPHILGEAEGMRFLRAAVQALAEQEKAKTNELLHEKIALASCKAAVKANTPLSRSEIESLLNRFDDLGELNCPHGRPIIVRMSKKDLEKLFRRIV